MLGYLLPSRYCESDRFNQMATEITAGQLLGYDQVKAIETWLKNTIRYVADSSDIARSAIEVNVCSSRSADGLTLREKKKLRTSMASAPMPMV